MSASRSLPRAEAMQMLRRAGYPPDRIAEIEAQLPDPVEVDRDGPILLRFGLTRDHLMDLMGGSP